MKQLSSINSLALVLVLTLFYVNTKAQNKWDASIDKQLPAVLKKHREFTSIPNVSANQADMYKNISYLTPEFEKLGFKVRLLESSTLPVVPAEKVVNPNAKTILFYFHLDGQPVNPANWGQEDPFVPVLKEKTLQGDWQKIDWNNVDGNIDEDWRIFGRAVADDKGPITMMLTALEIVAKEKGNPAFNVKIVLDLQEEVGSQAFISTLEKYKKDYAADYMIIMDGLAHNTNKPTLTFGCRGVATCSITVYGAKLPQHSGHYGNYAPNPIFTLSHLLASMKNEQGFVTIPGFYDGINITPEVQVVLENVPDIEEDIRREIGINTPDNVGNGYQESPQYPSLNVRHIETSWKGPGLKTVIPELITAHLDVRLVKETDGAAQIQKIKEYVQKQGYLVLDREPTDAERLNNRKIAKFEGNAGVNAFRTDMNAPLGQKLISALENYFGEKPVSIRTMDGTVPIVPAINTLQIPAVIVPMVNMDNNQHNPNENLRIGNMITGIKMCLVILTMELD
jgi:acetylornithine deacetylase/succinyl-diaminopimelate desuccinylase-like protein